MPASAGCGSPAPDSTPAPESRTPRSTQARDHGPKRPPELPAAFSLEFADPGPGPRAPSASAFRAEIGESDLAAVDALTRDHGLRCADTSVRAMMAQTRRQKIAAALIQEGLSVDALSSASWMRESPRERLPQVRFSCGRVASTRIDELDRPPSKGRLLYVFDAEDLPLRHASYQRTHADPAAALRDLEHTLERMTAIYGEPSVTRGSLPIPSADGRVEFEMLDNIEFEWRYADLLVKVTAMRVSSSSVTVGERLEVPIGIRPDAPTLLAPGPAEPEPE